MDAFQAGHTKTVTRGCWCCDHYEVQEKIPGKRKTGSRRHRGQKRENGFTVLKCDVQQNRPSLQLV